MNETFAMPEGSFLRTHPNTSDFGHAAKVNELEEKENQLLEQEGWRAATGW